MAKYTIMGDGLPHALVEMLGADFEVLPWDVAPGSEALERSVGVLTYGHPTVDGPLMDRMPKLRMISNHGVGVDHIDIRAAHARNIPVGNTPGCLDASTADLTMALLLGIARNLVIGDRYARGPEFLHHDPSILIGQEVHGSTLGIIGLGRIGRQVARRARAFDMPVLYHNRNRDQEAERELGVAYRSLDDLLAESDFVSLNCPLTSGTTRLIGRPQLRKMKRTGILINVARGAVVDTDALYEALISGTIAAAALDVTDPEPLPRDHPLLALENVIVLPHLGSASNRTRHRMMEMTVENLRAGLEGRELPWPVSPS